MKIEFQISMQNLGDDNSQVDNERYVRAVETAIGAEFPNADVSATLSNNFQQIRVIGFEDDQAVRETCEEIANQVWAEANY